MPVPWSDKPTYIEECQNRAITIQQLRDLSVFLQRLSAVGLLRSSDGRRLHWFELNMYDIRDIVKHVIEFHDDQRGNGSKSRRCSWVEFIAKGPKAPHVIFSHSWIGRFRDFMTVVDRFANANGLSAAVPIWICTFANNQFGEDFGSGVRESPFYKAVSASSGTVLVVDRDSSSLTRIWCGLEIHLTAQMGKPLSVYTSAGKVGEEVTSGRHRRGIQRHANGGV